MRKLNKKLILLFIMILIGLFYILNSRKEEPEGPGMTVTEETYDNDLLIDFSQKKFPDGSSIQGGGSVRKFGAATASFSGDTRKLPEWIEYEWREVPYYKNDSRPMEVQLAELNAQPLKRQRVLIASRVPQDVVNAVIASIKNKKEGQLPEKSLDVYFTWYKGHIYFSWRVDDEKVRSTDELTGGDVCPLDNKPISAKYPGRSCFNEND